MAVWGWQVGCAARCLTEGEGAGGVEAEDEEELALSLALFVVATGWMASM